MKKRTGAAWSYLAGEKGRNRVRAFEHRTTGRLFLEFRDAGQKKRVALGHRDRAVAKQRTDELVAALAQPIKKVPRDLTVGMLFDNYLREVTPTKGPNKQAHDRRAVAMWREVLGDHRQVETLSHRDAAQFIVQRKARGDCRKGRSLGRPIGGRIIEYDVRFAKAVLNWAVNARFIDRNPFHGFAPERAESPRQPLLSADQYEALLAVADQVPIGFKVALVVAHETGHRIGAVRGLRWSDVNFERGELHWQGKNDKQRLDHTTPMSPTLKVELAGLQRANLVIGDAWLIPSPKNTSRPASRHLLRDWWQRAEVLAGLSKEPGRGWHSLRRKFATELKHTPLKDLCALGGWKDPNTILKCYQRPDEETMRQALASRMRLQA